MGAQVGTQFQGAFRMAQPPIVSEQTAAGIMQHNTTLPTLPTLPRLIRRNELRQVVPLSDTTIYELELRNEFPHRIVLMPRVVAWKLAEIEAWIEQRRLDTDTGRSKVNAVPSRKRKRRSPER
jgi:prophage regulatory protein